MSSTYAHMLYFKTIDKKDQAPDDSSVNAAIETGRVGGSSKERGTSFIYATAK